MHRPSSGGGGKARSSSWPCRRGPRGSHLIARAVTAGWLDADSRDVRPPALPPSHRVKAPGLSKPQPRPSVRTAGEPLRKWLRLGLPGWS